MGPVGRGLDMYNRKERERIQTIQRRLAWVEQRAATLPNGSHDAQEAGALRWALAEIEKARGPFDVAAGTADGVRKGAQHVEA